MEIKSRSRFVKDAPDKIRILGNLLKKRNIDDAISQLENNNRYATTSLILLLKQTKDIIKNKDLKIEDFVITALMVDEGPKLKRRRIRHQGRATAILKRMSHITIILTDNVNSPSGMQHEIRNSKTKNPKINLKTENKQKETGKNDK